MLSRKEIEERVFLADVLGHHIVPSIRELFVKHLTKSFLINNNLLLNPSDLAVWYSFSRRIFYAFRVGGLAEATAVAAARRDLYVSWGFSADVCRRVAGLQGVLI